LFYNILARKIFRQMLTYIGLWKSIAVACHAHIASETHTVYSQLQTLYKVT
jgi:hypothetical protein